MSAIERLRSVADACSSTTDWSTARRAISTYLEAWEADVVELSSASLAVAVEAQVARLNAAPGCSRVVRSMRSTLAEARSATMRIARPGDDAGPTRLQACLPEDAPATEGLLVPAGYAVTLHGVFRVNEEETQVASRPVYLSAIIRDVEGTIYHADLVWRNPGGAGWTSRTYPRATLADSRALVRTARDGVPVDSTTAGALVRYLTAYEALNGERMPLAHCSSAMGWQGKEGALGFNWGTQCIGGEVRLQADGGKAQHASGYCSSGSLEEWRTEVWRRVEAYPRVVLGIYASLAPLVLGIVSNAPGFVIDWSGRSTGGKTTTLRVAASVWGDPARLIKSWSATTAAIEHLASFSAHLPTILDDTKEAKTNPDKVVRAVYQVTGTASKLRAHPDGLRETASFRTVLLSTGEVPITSFGTDTGAAARVLPIRGFPFSGTSDDRSRQTADALNAATLEYYGTVGPAVVRYLLANRAGWEGLRILWESYREEVSSASAGPFVGRAAPYVASIRLAAELMQEATGVKAHAEALQLVLECALEGASTAERHRAALRDLWDYLGSRPDLHDAREEERSSREVMVRWDQGPPAVIARSLRRWLDREGYQLDVVEEWARLGLLKVAPDGRTTHPVEFHSVGRRVRCYVFTSKAAAEAQPTRLSD